MNDEHTARTFVALLERELPQCNCLMSGVCPDRGAALCVVAKSPRFAVITLDLDVPRLSDIEYVNFILQQIRQQLPLR